MDSSQKTLFFNGVNADSGAYVNQPISTEVLATAVHEHFLPEEKALLGNLARLKAASEPHLGIDPRLNDLEAVRWAAVVSTGTSNEHRRALDDLVKHRKGVLLEWGEGESPRAFVARHGPRLGDPDYSKVPFYLFLVASPKEVSFSHQYQLSLDYGVGRMWSEDPADLLTYARKLIQAEARADTAACDVSVFAPNSDVATTLSSEVLIAPVANHLQAQIAPRGGAVAKYIGGDATKKALKGLLLAANPRPHLIFSATHGATYRLPSQQAELQGALVCQDWNLGTPLTSENTLSAADFGQDGEVRDLLLFCFACFSAGTPRDDGFAFLTEHQDGTRAASYDFLAALPVRLLRQGALAVIGHVDVAWSSSFSGDSRPELFSQTLTELAEGNRAGNAMRRFTRTHAAFSVELTELLERAKAFRTLPRSGIEKLLHVWLQKNDTRAYIIIGDPAIRLPVQFIASQRTKPR